MTASDYQALGRTGTEGSIPSRKELMCPLMCVAYAIDTRTVYQYGHDSISITVIFQKNKQH